MATTNMRQPRAEHKPLKQGDARTEGLRPVGPVFAKILADIADKQTPKA